MLFCLGLVDTVLLISALVLGMYCAKAKDFKDVSDPALTPLLIERDFLLNHSDVIAKELGVTAEKEKQRKAQVQMQVEIKQLQTVSDSLQSHIQALRADKAQLESNRTALEVSCGRCPVGWVFLLTSCYFYANFELPLKKNWTESRADCVRRGGDLLVINSFEEQKAINYHCPVTHHYQHWWNAGYWIGLKEGAMHGVLTWVNNAIENNTMNWKPDQPEASPGRPCVANYRNLVTWKSWYKGNCDNKLNWICEMEPR